jgi:hypothetical protein
MRDFIKVAYKHTDIFPNEFAQWLYDNAHVFEAFSQEAQKIINRGFKHYSARTIIHVLRHHSAIAEADGEWKINNNHSPYLARLFDLYYPHYAGLFEYRKIKNEQ